ncbi:MAG: cation-efflux pump, partial [Verrucomicrobiota bacterium]|nr:cation-efflux pump [Verrucomicrobiota bacterium]
EIMDTAPRGDVVERVRQAAVQVRGVREVEKCRLRKMGMHYYVDLHVRVNGDISVTDGHDIAHDVKDAIRLTNGRIADVLVHVEPENGSLGRKRLVAQK